ncbi:MAG: ATP cone domain-containing protein [Paludibacteraceae bacterium]|nr:ATP cone domain-containing protein [Paludibacteraceae bacterium]
MKVYKRNGEEQDFCLDKIIAAIKKANNSVSTSDRMKDNEVQKVVSTVQEYLTAFNSVKVEDIQDLVEKALMKHNKYIVAKSYILYRNEKLTKKKFTENEEKVLSIVSGGNSEMRAENANKHIDVNCTVRDYIAGTLCKSLAEKILPKKIVEAHKKKWIHFHDMDYSPVMNLTNCCLINADDMLQNGFQMGDVYIEKPRRFSTAANLLAQINAQVASAQYGGQTVSWAHLVPFVESTRNAYKAQLQDFFAETPCFIRWVVKPFYKRLAELFTRHDIYTGIKTYQYQTLSCYTSNGQTPFVSNVLNLREAETEQEQKDLAVIIEEILKRRLKGVKDKSKQFVGPLFPKLLYFTCDGLNVNSEDPYYYLTKLAAKCISLRMQPDIMSEKQNREVKSGQMIACMGCRSFLAPVWEEISVPATTKFHWQLVEDSNVQYQGAPGKNFDYNRGFGTYSTIPTNAAPGEVVINFRGNSGWVKSYDAGTDEFLLIVPKTYGRFNQGVVTINLPHAALTAVEHAKSNPELNLDDEFWKVLDERLELCHEGLLERWKSVQRIQAKNSPILWMHGAICRLQPNDYLADYIKTRQNVSQTSISLGYVGLCETCWAIKGVSNTTDEGRAFCKAVLSHVNTVLTSWKLKDNLGYAAYGTPEEQLTTSAAAALQRDFGLIEHITDKDYVVNSYHVDPREDIDAFKKLEIEGEYLALSSGGAVSYVETPDLENNPEAIETLIRFMHEHIMYAEVNRKIGVCYKCGFQGEIPLTKTSDAKFIFTCPHCGNTDDNEMNITARLCGYIGKVNAGETTKGRLDDIYNRTLHLE